MLTMAAVYIAAGKTSLMLAYRFPSASPVWPPTGIAIAILLLLGPRYWPSVFMGAFAVNMITAGSVATSIAIAAGNTFEGIIGAALIARFASGTKAFERVNGVLAFALVAITATTVSASIGSLALLLGGFAAWPSAWPMWFTWWIGDMVGALTVAPLIILWVGKPSPKFNRGQAAEITLLLASVAVLGLLFFTTVFFSGTAHYPLAYLFLLPLLWSAIRFGPRETATVVAILSSFAIAGTLRRAGPFAVASANASLLLLESFIAVASLIGLTLAAALRERKASEDFLEQKVLERMNELEAMRRNDRANLQRLRATILHLPMGALLMDEKGVILELNEAYCRMFHIGLSARKVRRIPQDELLSRFMQSLLHPEEHMLKVHSALDRRESVFDEEILLKDGRIILRDFIPIYEEARYRGQLFLYRDVTQERRADQAKSEFMSLASHQLRTPLTGVRWGLGRLNKDLSGTLDLLHAKILDEGQAAAKQMAETIDTMLKISRIEARHSDITLDDVDLVPLLKEKESIFREQLKSRHQSFSIECPVQLSVKTDATFLKEILRNLIQNAIKYTPDGGNVALRAKETAGAIVIEVEDNGYGIPLRQQKNVFQKFFRGDNIVSKDTSGTGLGLYLVSLLTEALGATISMTSEEGKGTMFRLSLRRGQ